MRSLVFLIFFMTLFLSAIVFAEQEWLYAPAVRLEMNVSSALHIRPLAENYKLTSMTVNLSFVPKKTDHQKIQSIITAPSAVVTDEDIVYTFKPPFSSTTLFYAGTVLLQNKPVEVTEKVSFPYEHVPESVRMYLSSTDIIDADDPAVLALATSLAEGSDDAFVVLTGFASWVQQNVVYNLSTLGEPATKKASWVLRNKRGVCSELTTLFIALARSVGIPARFVSGLAYTDSALFQERWGGHAWAEVYLPGFGWVPFDPTYGQYGFVDSSHITAKYTIDAKDVTTNYKWIGKDVDVSLDKLKLSGAVLSAQGTTKPISLSLTVIDDRVRFGSYNVIQARVKNDMPYYLSVPVTLTKVQDVVNVDTREKSITLLPEQEKIISWIVHVKPSLEPSFIYTLPLEVRTPYAIAKGEFTAAATEDELSLDKAKEIVLSSEEELEKVYSKNIGVVCKSKQEIYYEYDVGTATCTIHNSGTISLKDLHTCIQEDCQGYDLSLGKEKTFSFLFTPNSSASVIPVTTENDLIKKIVLLNVTSYDVPSVSFKDISYPTSVASKQNVLITFTLEKTSKSTPYQSRASLFLNGEEYVLQQGDVNAPKRVNLSIQSRDLLPGKNTFTLFLLYEDKNGKSYEAKETFSIQLTNATIWQHIRKWMYQLFGTF